MRNITSAAIFAVVCLVSSNAMAAIYSPVPPDSDLGDLDHYRYYTWGLETPWSIVPDANDEYERVISATLSFDDIRNWDNNPNVLYIHLLDNAPLGVRVDYDGQGGGDNFANLGTLLTVYHNLPSTSQDLSYSFTEPQINTLNKYAADGRFALGFDPDCHFYNRGVQLDICTEVVSTPPIPEPATMTMLLVGGLAVLRRRRK